MGTSWGFLRAPVPDRDTLRVVALVGLIYPLVTGFESVLASQYSLPVLARFELVAALPVPLMLSFGSAALWAIPVGYVLGDVTSNAVGPGTLVGVGAHLYIGYSAGKVARKFGFDRFISLSRFVRRPVFGRYLLLAGVSAAGGAAITGWGSEIVHGSPFYLAVGGSFVEYFLLAAALTYPLVGLFRTVTATAATRFDIGWPRLDTMSCCFSLRRVTAITVAWIALGSVGSIGYRTFQKFPAEVYTDRNLDLVLLLDRPALFGSGAGRLQVLLGAFFFSLLLVVFMGRGSLSGVSST